MEESQFTECIKNSDSISTAAIIHIITESKEAILTRDILEYCALNKSQKRFLETGLMVEAQTKGNYGNPIKILGKIRNE